MLCCVISDLTYWFWFDLCFMFCTEGLLELRFTCDFRACCGVVMMCAVFWIWFGCWCLLLNLFVLFILLFTYVFTFEVLCCLFAVVICFVLFVNYVDWLVCLCSCLGFRIRWFLVDMFCLLFILCALGWLVYLVFTFGWVCFSCLVCFIVCSLSWGLCMLIDLICWYLVVL